jgi:hypothetical protein
MIVPFPDTLKSLVIYLHECGHLAKLYDKCGPLWIEEIEAEFFMLQIIARSRNIRSLCRSAVESNARGFILSRLCNSGVADPERQLGEEIVEFIAGKRKGSR